MTSKETLAASQVRGPSVFQQSFVVDGLTTDRYAHVTITGYPHNVRSGSDDIPIFQMHVAEGNGAVASTHSRAKAHTLTGTLALNTTNNLVGAGSQTGSTPFGYSRNVGTRSTTEATSYTPTTGRLTQSRRDYREHTGDMLWHIAVVVYDKNMLHTFAPKTTHTLVPVSDGITFLRLSTQVPDPAPVIAGTSQPAVPADSVPLLRTLRPGQDPTAAPATGRAPMEIPTMPAFPGSTTRIPIVPLVPPTAVSERLFPVPVQPPAPQDPAAQGLAPPAKVDVTGADNPLLAMVRGLLPPYLLEHDGWTVAAGDEAALDGQVPSKLRNLLNVGSMEALLDGLVSTGLVLTAIWSMPLANERIQVVLRATRDPDNNGYKFLEQVQTISVSRYWFRLNTESTSRARTDSQSLSTGTTITEAPTDEARRGQRHRDGEPVDEGQRQPRPFAVANRRCPRHPVQRRESQPLRRRDRHHGHGDDDHRTVAGGQHRHAQRGQRDRRLGAGRRPVGEPPGRAGAGDRAPQLPTRSACTSGSSFRPNCSPPTSRRWSSRRRSAPRAPSRGQPSSQPRSPRSTSPSTVDSLRGTELGITRQDLLNRDAVAFGFDPAKLRVMFDLAMARFTGATRPLGQEGTNFNHTGLAADGSRAQDALHYLMSYQMFTRQLENMLGTTFRSPRLVREGLFNTTGRLSVEVDLMNPQLGGYSNSWLESVDYGFTEFNRNAEQQLRPHRRRRRGHQDHLG